MYYVKSYLVTHNYRSDFFCVSQAFPDLIVLDVQHMEGPDNHEVAL